MQSIKPVKIFLGSSITELEREREMLGDYIMNSVRPLFKLDELDLELIKCEDMDLAYMGTPSQDVIDGKIKECDAFIFLLKTDAGEYTRHEFGVACEVQKQKQGTKPPIYVYSFKVPEKNKSDALKDFQKQLKDVFWKTCKNKEDLRGKIEHALIVFERKLCGKTTVEEESPAEKDADARFNRYVKTEKAQAEERKKLHQDIDDLLQQTKTVMADETDTVAGRILRTKELYQKADFWASKTDYDKEKYSDLLFSYADFLYDYGLYRDAEAVYLRQIPMVEELYGKEHEETATVYNNLGLVYRNLGDYPKALEYYGKALEIVEKVLGKEHPDTATSYNNIGAVYNAQGDYPKALEYCGKALEIVEKVLGKEHPYTAGSYNNISGVYLAQGDYPKALEYFGKALAIREEVLGKEHPDTATSYNNIGSMYYQWGKYPEALEYLEKALKIRKAKLGEDHPYTKATQGWIDLTLAAMKEIYEHHK